MAKYKVTVNQGSRLHLYGGEAGGMELVQAQDKLLELWNSLHYMECAQCVGWLSVMASDETATNTKDGRRSFVYLGVEYAITAC